MRALLFQSSARGQPPEPGAQPVLLGSVSEESATSFSGSSKYYHKADPVRDRGRRLRGCDNRCQHNMRGDQHNMRGCQTVRTSKTHLKCPDSLGRNNALPELCVTFAASKCVTENAPEPVELFVVKRPLQEETQYAALKL